MPKLLLAEDDPHIANGLKFNLEMEGYDVQHTADGLTAKEWLFDQEQKFDLIILDIMLPNLSGFDLCYALRKNRNYTPVLILTAKNFEKDKIQGLQLGADDYLTKPFNLEELLTRIQVLLRRQSWAQEEPQDILIFRDVTIDFLRFVVQAGTQTLRLTSLEMKLMKVFSENEGRVMSREELLEKVWNIHDSGSLRTVDNFILRLRRFFEKDPSNPLHFHSVRGIGYKFTRTEENF